MSKKQQPQRFVPPGTVLGAATTVRILLSYTPGAFFCAFVTGYHPSWGITAGTMLLVASIVVACRYRVPFRAIFQRTRCDERKLYGTCMR